MKFVALKLVPAVALLAAAIAVPQAHAVGCLSGAAVGGVAGHVAGHHGVIGAAAGCAVGHHANTLKKRQAAQNASQQTTAPQPQ